MTAFRRRAIFVLITVSVLISAANAADLPGTGPDVGKTVVYCDTWGVPHIYAPTMEAGMYAIGWAQAEDRPEELLKNFLRAMGQSARFDGPIYYQRTGRMPRRLPGYNWSRPVDGSTSSTEWKGLHPAFDHLQVLNPLQGYMQNCNIPPDVMMVDSPFSPDKTISYIYGSSGGHTNQRGARAVQLLHADSSVTVEEALAYAVDVHPYGIKRWLEVLKQADARFGDIHQSNPDYQAGIKDILSWDGDLRRSSTAALKYYYWRKQIVEDHGEEAVSDAAGRVDYHLAALGKPAPEIDLSDDELEAAAYSFASAMAQLKDDHASLDATYGDTFRVGRDDVS